MEESHKAFERLKNNSFVTKMLLLHFWHNILEQMHDINTIYCV